MKYLKTIKLIHIRDDKYEPIKPMFRYLKGKAIGNFIADAYLTLNQSSEEFHQIDEKCQKPCLFSDAPAGSKMHHFWPNGLWQHLGEMWTIANELYRNSNDGLHTRNETEFNFKLEDVAVCILLHDLSKAIAFQWKEFKVPDPVFPFEYRKGFFSDMSYDNQTQWLMSRFNIVVTYQQLIGILHTEGGWGDLAKSRKDGNMLGKFMHVLDLYSSQQLGGRFTEVKKFITAR